MLKASVLLRKINFAMREIAVVFDPERKFFLYFGVVFLAVGVGPFGTYDAMDFWQRTVFWSLDILGGLLIIVPVVHVVYHSRILRRIPPLPRFVLGVAFGAIPAAAFITVLYGSVGTDLEISTPYPLLFVQVTVFSTILLLTEYVLWPAVFGGSRSRARAASADDGAGMGPSLGVHASADLSPLPDTPDGPVAEKAAPVPHRVRLIERLPAELRGAEILSISMQDHYAEVSTTAGKTMLLMRLSDAIDLLDGLPGAQIHRSHWAARGAVVAIEKAGRRHEVVLGDGRRLPIGATHLAVARQVFPVDG